MANLQKLIDQFNQLYNPKDLPPIDYKGGHPPTYTEAYDAGWKLWNYPSYEKEIKKEKKRKAYIDALIRVSDYFKYSVRRKYIGVLKPSPISPSRISYLSTAPLKRAYLLDDGDIVPSAGFSYKEIAAYKLGILYKEAKCHHSAIFWFHRSLDLARDSRVKANILGNLHQLAWNYETLGLFSQAGQYYEEMLEILSIPSHVQPPLDWIIHAAMYHIRHGDEERGKFVMWDLIKNYLGTPRPSEDHSMLFPEYFYTTLNSFVLLHINNGNYQVAIDLSKLILENAQRFEKPEWVVDATHGLIAKALVRLGKLKEALQELSLVYEVDTNTFIHFPAIGQNIALWIDIARIHMARRCYDRAIAAYQIAAYHFGTLLVDRERADTTRLRFYWLQQMTFVVHEMVSAWITISDPHVRQELEARVANALLQLKANLFIAIEVHKDLRFSSGNDLFAANRRYAVAARKAMANPTDQKAWLDLEDALFEREDIERCSLEEDAPNVRFASEISELLFQDNPSMRRFTKAHLSSMSLSSERSYILHFDFRNSRELDENTLFLDYSVINFQPPENGLAGTAPELRYVGIRVSKGGLRLLDLGPAEKIDALCRPLIQAMSEKPGDSKVGIHNLPKSMRALRPTESPEPVPTINLDQFSEAVYDRIVAKFEPLSQSLLVSPSGLLAALPFHALLHKDRYLIEDRDVAYCHSLLQKESLSMRTAGSSVRYSPPINNYALLLGDPNYTTNNLPSLHGTKLEISQIAGLLTKERMAFLDTKPFTEHSATASRLLEYNRPRILHIAAHGTSESHKILSSSASPIADAGFYRLVEDMGALPFSQIDDALLQATIFLSDDPSGEKDPADGVGAVTALELASLNLLGCHLVVLSACETGSGASAYGAGVLGFQYALQASCARNGLLSLWKILDRETNVLMVDIYRTLLDQHSVQKGYYSILRQYCRRNGQRVHPYHWAAFILLTQAYVDYHFNI